MCSSSSSFLFCHNLCGSSNPYIPPQQDRCSVGYHMIPLCLCRMDLWCWETHPPGWRMQRQQQKSPVKQRYCQMGFTDLQWLQTLPAFFLLGLQACNLPLPSMWPCIPSSVCYWSRSLQQSHPAFHSARLSPWQIYRVRASGYGCRR